LDHGKKAFAAARGGKKVGLKVSQIYEMMSRGEFPEPVPLSRRAVAWIEAEIDQWIAERIASRKPQKWQPVAAA
jgi:predicted DNA-binding transcriptional regulator AlpA